MPPSAYGLIATFTLVSLLSGIAAARVVGPRRWWAVVVPALAAFGGLYLLAHRWPVSIGPTMELFGWEVALAFDIAVALVAAFAAAILQGSVPRLFQSKQGSPGGDHLA